MLNSIESEYERLGGEASDDAVPGGVGAVRFVVRCPLGAQQVLDNAKEVLLIIDRVTISSEWPSLEVWKRHLPEWFVGACAPEMTKAQAEQWLNWWQSLAPDQQAEAEKEKDWSLADWLYWMQPENRQWFWWDAKAIVEKDHVLVAVEVLAWPFPWGSLRWLFRASGASSMDPEM